MIRAALNQFAITVFDPARANVGANLPPVTESDILGPSEAFRRGMDYFSHSKHARGMLERLASTSPGTLACMHGSAWRGDGAALLRALADSLSA